MNRITTALLSLLWLAPCAQAEPNNPHTDWFSEAKFGVFVHFLPSGTDGLKQVGQFEVNALADQVADLRAGYLVLTLGQNSMNPCPSSPRRAGWTAPNGTR